MKYLSRFIDIVIFDIIGKASRGVRATLRRVYDAYVTNK